MKNNLIIIFLILIFTSCNKKTTTPSSLKSENNFENTSLENYYTRLRQNFKFNQQIRVYDISKINYFDVEILSNDELEFKTNCEYFKMSEMVLLDSIPVFSNSNPNSSYPRYTDNLNLLSNDFSASIIFKNVNKGTAKGYTIKPKYESKTSATHYIVGFFGSITFYFDPCSYYSVLNTSTTTGNSSIIGEDYAFNGSNYVFISSAFCYKNQNTFFSGAGYVPRQFRAVGFGFISAYLTTY